MTCKELMALLVKASAAYYAGRPFISDEEYDARRRQLKKMVEDGEADERAALVLAQVGSHPPAGSRKVERDVPMLSLDNCFTREEFDAFHSRMVAACGDVEYSLEPKFDGLSLELVYRRGVLVEASTRGDGRVGEDVTATAMAVPTIPRVLPDLAHDELRVRGEAILTRSSFKSLNDRTKSEGGEPYANARNAAAGIVRSKSASWKTRQLTFVAYDAVPQDVWATQRELFEDVAEGGFVVPRFVVARTADDVEAVYERAAAVHALRKRGAVVGGSYELDGMVVKLNSVAARRSLEEEGRRAPKWAIAWKFESQKAVTTIRSVTDQVGRTGRITPVAELEPVEVCGVTVTRATLHNYDLVAKHDYRAGDSVLVERAGDVIPEVVENLTVKRGVDRPGRHVRVNPPGLCPRCGSVVKRDGKYARCSAGEDCAEQLVRRLVHWCSREVADVDGFGARLAERLVESGAVRSLADLYSLDEAALAELPGVGERTARKVVSQLAASADMPLWKFVFGLGLDGVGKSTAKALAAEFGDAVSLVCGVSIHAVAALPRVGEKTAAKVVEAVEDAAGTVRALLDAGVRPSAPASDAEKRTEGPLSGELVVFTGALPVPRREAQERAEMAGATVVGSVTRRTTVVVVGENPGSKLRKARELGVREMDYAEFDGLA